jgi:hypothetical protein
VRAAVASLSRPARVLRLEIRRSVVLWAIPLLAALLHFPFHALKIVRRFAGL